VVLFVCVRVEIKCPDPIENVQRACCSWEGYQVDHRPPWSWGGQARCAQLGGFAGEVFHPGPSQEDHPRGGVEAPLLRETLIGVTVCPCRTRSVSYKLSVAQAPIDFPYSGILQITARYEYIAQRIVRIYIGIQFMHRECFLFLSNSENGTEACRLKVLSPFYCF